MLSDPVAVHFPVAGSYSSADVGAASSGLEDAAVLEPDGHAGVAAIL